jgi:ABC-type Fe3+-hydroxamate transport system substrate-binding protein
VLRFTDQIGKEIALEEYPQRIVSLVPSQTELLFDLGLQEEVIGITNFCVHPREQFLRKRRIGGTKSPSIRKIKELKPDLVIANKEENNREDIAEIASFCPVWTSDISNLEEALQMIKQVGAITGKADEGSELAKQIEVKFGDLRKVKSQDVVYLIWKKPYMAAGNDTFIHHMLEKAGWKNRIEESRYPEVGIEELQRLNPDMLLLSSEPYPFKDKDLQELSLKLPQTRVILVDGELFSWYGSRLLQTPDYINGLNQLQD